MDIGSSNWSEVDASNTTASPDGAPEGMAPSGVNNVLRAVMGAVKRFYSWINNKRTAGSAAAYTLSYAVAPGALIDGMTHLVEFHTANSASATLNVNALGATPLHILKPAGWGAIPANTVIDGMVCRVAYHAGSGAYRILSGPTTEVVSGTSSYSVGPASTRKQRGQVAVGVGSPAAVTFPVAFSATPYTIQVTANGASGALSAYHSATSVSSTGFTLTNNGTNNINFLWFAEGPA